MTTQKVFSSRALNVDADTYVGEAGRLFYAQTTSTGVAPVLKYSDGSTPGGLPLSGGSLTFSSPTPPPNPSEGNLWWNTVDGRLYIYYDNSWIDASPDVVGDYGVSQIVAGTGISINTSTGIVTITATTATNAARATTATNLAAATGILAGTFTVSPNVAKNSLTTLTATITGLTTNHKIVITPQTVMPDNATFFGAAYASASNTVSIQLAAGGGAVNATFTIAYFAWV